MANDGILSESAADIEALRRLSTMGNSEHVKKNISDVRLDFEKNFDDTAWQVWLENYWWLSIVASVMYIFTIFSIQRFMKHRHRLELRGLLIVWNVALAAFSIFGACRSLKAMYITLTSRGLHESICTPGDIYSNNEITGVWAMYFEISKVVEFGDTLFIVLRKGNLIFLHWYHHVTVLIYVCYSATDRTSTGYWFMLLNFMVHSVMYSYYAFRAARIRLPKIIPMSITAMQLLQMIGGCAVQHHVNYSLNHGYDCQVTSRNNFLGSLMYGSYLLLFAQFFYKAYLTTAPKPLSTKRQLKEE
uniref:Elongation of very long chain fatty acids protein n=1 Tax=Saccoglossus kowalevskii TaxID=10224 RepID=A0ABM0GZB4_SACKO|nr:PREDICTED: elongation of very long chain fatty acids protein 6-like [Saccoglossus kowalevskii]